MQDLHFIYRELLTGEATKADKKLCQHNKSRSLSARIVQIGSTLITEDDYEPATNFRNHQVTEEADNLYKVP